MSNYEIRLLLNVVERCVAVIGAGCANGNQTAINMLRNSSLDVLRVLEEGGCIERFCTQEEYFWLYDCVYDLQDLEKVVKFIGTCNIKSPPSPPPERELTASQKMDLANRLTREANEQQLAFDEQFYERG